MSARVWRGYWWLPSAPEDRVPGQLVVEADGACRLELVGGLDLRENEGDGHAPAIFGAAEGQDITLLRCFTKRSDGLGRRPQRFHDIHVHEALVGAHVGPDEPAFQSALVSIEHLSSWLAMEQMIDRTDEQGAERAAVARPVDRSCEFEGWTITARGLPQPFQTVAERARLTVTGEIAAYLVIRPPEPAAAAAFHGMVLELMDLLTLASGEASGQISLKFVHKDPNLQRGSDGTVHEWERQVESLGPLVHTPRADAPSPHVWQFRFTCNDLPFEEVAPRWLALRRRAPAACNVFFGMRYARPTFTEVRLLLTAITAEALHGALYSDETELSDEDFQSLRSRVLGVLDNEGERQWVKQKLRNTPSFRERLIALASKPDDAARETIIADVPRWARSLRTTRDNLAHTGNEATTDDIFKLEWITSSLLTLVFMAELGFSAEVQQRAARDVLQLPASLR
ncbi:ApeA N-terminal domain 1-containing protein [Microbacterium lacticum]